MKNFALKILAGFFIVAGTNHFIMPSFYLPLIPEYLPFPQLINIVSGVLEIIFGIGLLSLTTRLFSAWGIIVLLLLFIPAHVHFIQIGSCVEDGLCVDPIIAWVRLIVIHPLLIVWTYWLRE
jgi:uncharacterized membrane protein